MVAPRGQARTEWDIVVDLISRMKVRTPVFVALRMAARRATRRGKRLSPRPVIDGMIRMADGGDRFGLRRGGLTFRRLAEEHPHGVVVAPNIRTGVLGEVVVYPKGGSGSNTRTSPPRSPRCRDEPSPTVTRCA